MRLGFEEGADHLVENLEKERESISAQAAFALADCERRSPRHVGSPSV
jgi:HEAT repeat protein